MHLCVFTAILVPKLVAPLSLVYGSVTGEFNDRQTLSQNQTLHGYVAYNWSYGHFLWYFCLFWPKIRCHCNQKCLLWIDRPRKSPVISNRILVISRRSVYAFIAIFVPKLVAPLSLVYGSVTDDFSNGTNPISKPNSAWICCIQLKLWPFFVIFLPILAKIWLPWQRYLDRCNQKCLLWLGRPCTKTPCYK